MVDLVEDIMDIMLFESLDTPLEIEKGRSKFDDNMTAEKTLIKYGAGNVTVYNTVNFDPEIEFYVFKYKGMWEFHFNNVTEGFNVGDLSIYDGRTAMKILSTVYALAKDKINSGEPVRLYVLSDKLKSLLLRKIESEARAGNIEYRVVNGFKEITGQQSVTAYEIRPNSKESIDEII